MLRYPFRTAALDLPEELDDGAIPDGYLTVASTSPTDRLPDDLIHLAHRREAALLPAEQDEVTEWSLKGRLLHGSVEEAWARIHAAEAALATVREAAAADMRAAWAEYLPVHRELERRVRATEIADAQAARQRAADEAAAEAAAETRRLAEEDERLGPRTYFLWRPADNGHCGPRMDVPTVHLAICPLALVRQNVTPERLVRADTVASILTHGVKPRRTDRRRSRYRHELEWHVLEDGKPLDAKVCGRCRVADQLLQDIPDTYVAWKERTDNHQPAAPSMSALVSRISRFGAQLYRPASVGGYVMSEGWATVPSAIVADHRQAGAVTEAETLLGFVVADPKDAAKGVWKRYSELQLNDLIRRAACAGFVVRPVTDVHYARPGVPADLNLWVAVRVMTKAEKSATVATLPPPPSNPASTTTSCIAKEIA